MSDYWHQLSVPQRVSITDTLRLPSDFFSRSNQTPRLLIPSDMHDADMPFELPSDIECESLDAPLERFLSFGIEVLRDEVSNESYYLYEDGDEWDRVQADQGLLYYHAMRVMQEFYARDDDEGIGTDCSWGRPFSHNRNCDVDMSVAYWLSHKLYQGGMGATLQQPPRARLVATPPAPARALTTEEVLLLQRAAEATPPDYRDSLAHYRQLCEQVDDEETLRRAANLFNSQMASSGRLRETYKQFRNSADKTHAVPGTLLHLLWMARLFEEYRPNDPNVGAWNEFQRYHGCAADARMLNAIGRKAMRMLHADVKPGTQLAFPWALA